MLYTVSINLLRTTKTHSTDERSRHHAPPGPVLNCFWLGPVSVERSVVRISRSLDIQRSLLPKNISRKYCIVWMKY